MSKLSLGRMKVTHCTECVFSCFLKSRKDILFELSRCVRMDGLAEEE